MSELRKDVCVVCSKTIKECHTDISCKVCKLYVHKKCTKLKTKELKRLNEWKCKRNVVFHFISFYSVLNIKIM